MKTISKLLVALFIVLGATSLSSCSESVPCPERYVDAYKGSAEVAFYKSGKDFFAGRYIVNTKNHALYNECDVVRIVATALEEGTILRISGGLCPLKVGEPFIVNIHN